MHKKEKERDGEKKHVADGEASHDSNEYCVCGWN